jgi:serine/threonine protein kinase
MADSKTPKNNPRTPKEQRTKGPRRKRARAAPGKTSVSSSPGQPAGKKRRTRAPASPDARPVGSDTVHNPLVGKTIGGSRILEPLGKGAMGAVYKGQQVRLDRFVALKTIREDFCSDDDFLKRFRHEARIVGRFKTPFVVQIHDVGCDQGVHFITMEYVSNGNLQTYLKKQRTSFSLSKTRSFSFSRRGSVCLRPSA